jgi:outer membrane protein assembly factor BamB
MDRELTLHPETERTRDLIYSEYSSCDRSLHLLVQDNPAVPYDFLLKIYRETVSAYLSSADIRTPVDFFAHLISRFDRLQEEEGLPAECLGSLGVHVVLRAVDALYLATSRECDVLVREGAALVPLCGSGAAGRLRLDPSVTQQELFPHKFKDVFTALRLDASSMEDRDLVLGCSESEKGTVLDGLSSPLWKGERAGEGERAARSSILSRFVSHKILILRFGDLARSPARASAPDESWPPRLGAFRRRRWPALAAGVLVVAVLIALLWRREPAGPGSREFAGPPGGSLRDRRPESVSEVNPERPRGAAPAALHLTEAWRRSYPDQVTSSPAIAGDLVLFGCRDGNVYALERASGDLLWKFAATAGIGASPEVIGERLLVADYNGWVYALATRSGVEIWKRKLPAKIVSSPHVRGDRVLVGCLDGFAYCLSAVDGNLYWKKKTNGRIRGSPASSEDAFFVPSYDGYLYGFSAATGEQLWRCGLGGPVASSPAVQEGSVVVGSPDGSVHCIEASSGRVRWKYSAESPVKSSVAIFGGRVFVGTDEGGFLALNLADGSLLWRHNAGAAVLARPLVRDGVVYVGSYDGRLYALDESTGRQLESFAAGAEIFSSPAADEESLYFGTNRGDFLRLTRSLEASS